MTETTTQPSWIDWETLRHELQGTYGVRVDADDPMYAQAHLFQLVIRSTCQQASAVVASHLGSALAQFTQDLNGACKQRREESHRDIIALSVIARGEINIATRQSQEEIRSVAADLRVAGLALKAQNRSMRVFDWFVGSVFMAIVLLLGYGAGRMLPWR